MSDITTCTVCTGSETGPRITYYKRRMIQSFPTAAGKRHYHAAGMESGSLAGIKKLVAEKV